MKANNREQFFLWLDKHVGCDLISTVYQFRVRFNLDPKIAYAIIEEWEYV